MHVRAGEAGFQSYFRCDRYLQINGQWHFTTREQTVEGPYDSKTTAQGGLRRYIDMVNCQVFNQNERQTIQSLKLQS